jgi:hypothetical protein
LAPTSATCLTQEKDAFSHLVVLIDGLESLGLLSRQRDASDRRKVRVFLTATGSDVAGMAAELTRSMENRLFRALDKDENHLLGALLRKLAVDQGLRPGVHPAFPENLGGE